MVAVNAVKKVAKVVTHGGAVASKINAFDELVRTTQACLLWEDQFYENGESIADRIKSLVHQCKPDAVAALAFTARSQMHLRHVPLLIVRELARHKDSPKYKGLVRNALVEVIQRPDELAEFLALYWADGKQPLSAQVKKGLAAAFAKFNAYSLAKYKGENKEVSLKDVLFLSHAKPKDVTPDMSLWNKAARAAYANTKTFDRSFTDGELMFGKLIYGQLETPDTWETNLSSGKDKKETFTRLMAEGNLGGLAFLRNLRNMKEAGIAKKVVADYAKIAKVDRILPFRFIAAARILPEWEDVIEPMMLRCLENAPKLAGKTVFIVDISGSMGGALSSKSDLNRLDTALALAILAREVCEEVAIYATAGNDGKRVHATALVPSRKGFALAEAIKGMNATLGGGGIFLTQVMDYVSAKEKNADRVLVLTDEQDCDLKCNPAQAKAFGDKNYIINIASAKHGIAYNKFTHITGWSEKILDFIQMHELNYTQEVA